MSDAFIGIAENKIRVAHAGQSQRHVVVLEQAHRLVTLHVGELVRVIMRHQKHAVLLPLEGFLRPFFAGPYGRKPAAFDDIDDLVEGEFQAAAKFFPVEFPLPAPR